MNAHPGPQQQPEHIAADSRPQLAGSVQAVVVVVVVVVVVFAVVVAAAVVAAGVAAAAAAGVVDIQKSTHVVVRG